MPTVLSLGAGVQSSTVLLMAAAGELDDVLPSRPQLAIFADTGWEPSAVYDWLEYLTEAVAGRVEIVRVQHGNIREDSLTVRTSKKSGNTYANAGIPFFVRNPDGSAGIMPRRCTRTYKIEPIHRELRRRGYGPKSRVTQVMGISLDEVVRMKDSRIDWIDHAYPLVDKRMTRADCLTWMESAGHPVPPRSACIGCPYHSDAEWRRLRDDDPDAFEDAVEFEQNFRLLDLTSIKGEPFLHEDRVPLPEADLSTPEDHGQFSFADECEGMCGI